MRTNQYQIESFATDLPDAGFYSWDVPENIVYADGALAHLFGLDPAESEKGLPIEIYLKRVHPEDLPRLAKTISDSIIAHRPQQETYRVLDADGRYVTVSSFGRCFRNSEDQPARYVGIVIPTSEAAVEPARTH